MRLIDADKFIEWLDIGHLRNPSEVCLNELNVINMINSQPTSYDVDKAVKHLDAYKQIMKNNWIESSTMHDGMLTNYYRGRYNAAVDMVEIVKGAAKDE